MEGINVGGRDGDGEVLGGLCAAELGMDSLDVARLLEVHCARDAIKADLDADELGWLAEDGALVDGSIRLDERLCRGSRGRPYG